MKAGESTHLAKDTVIVSSRSYRDIFWLVLFVIHLVITFGLLIAGIVQYKVHFILDYCY